ncbi:MAG: hypothetical protein V3V84_08330 [Candidatus Bathyarchaeia archaeon]
MTRLYNPFSQYLDSNSTVLSGGNVTVTLAGTTTLVELFTDDSLEPEFALENPFTLDDKGASPSEIHYAPNVTVKMLIKTSANVLYATTDNIPPLGDANSSAMLYSASTTYSITERVLSAGIWYLSNVSGNKGNDPLSSPSFWTPEHLVREYNAQFAYGLDATAFEDGVPFRSRIAGNLDNIPSISPDEWANMSGIGIQTINIPASILNTIGADPPLDTNVINAQFVVVTRQYDDAATEAAQFSVEMPESWDLGFLQVIYMIIPRAVVTGGSTAVFGISGIGFGDGDDMSTASFGPAIDTVIEGVSLENNVYLSDPVSFIPDSVSTPNRIVYFQVIRDTTQVDDDVFLAAVQVMNSTTLTLTGAAPATQQVAGNVTLTSATDTSSSEFTINGKDQQGTTISEQLMGPNATTVQTTLLFSSITTIDYDVQLADSVSAGYISGDDITIDLGLLQVRILYTTSSSTDNA